MIKIKILQANKTMITIKIIINPKNNILQSKNMKKSNNSYFDFYLIFSINYL
jgi:hypothetical protein